MKKIENCKDVAPKRNTKKKNKEDAIKMNTVKKNNGTDPLLAVFLKQDENADFLNNIRNIEVKCKVSLEVEPKKEEETKFAIPRNMSELKQYADVLIPADAISIKISHRNSNYVDAKYRQILEGLLVIPNYKKILSSFPESISINAEYKIGIAFKSLSVEVKDIDSLTDGTFMEKKDVRTIMDTIIPDNAKNISVKDTLPRYKEVRFTIREYRQDLSTDS